MSFNNVNLVKSKMFLRLAHRVELEVQCDDDK